MRVSIVSGLLTSQSFGSGRFDGEIRPGAKGITHVSRDPGPGAEIVSNIHFPDADPRARLADGRRVEAELVVLATGYRGLESLLPDLFGEAVAARVGQVWGFDADQELANMWTRTPQPGLWFSGGAFSQVRMFSRHLARQIAQALPG